MASYIRLEYQSIDPQFQDYIARGTSIRYGVIPLAFDDDALVVATCQPDNDESLRLVSQEVQKPVQPLMSTYADTRSFLLDMLNGENEQRRIPPKLGELFWQTGKLDREDLDRALAEHVSFGKSIGAYCLSKGHINELDLVEALAWQQNFPHVRLKGSRLNPKMAPFISADLAEAYKLLPLWFVGGVLYVGTIIPERQDVLVSFLGKLNIPIQIVICQPSEWDFAFGKIYRQPVDSVQRSSDAIRYPGPQLGELLVAVGLLSADQLDETLQTTRKKGRRLGERLINMGYLDDVDLAEALSLQTGIPYIRLNQVRFSPKLLNAISPELAHKHQMLPIIDNQGNVWVAVSDPFDAHGLHMIESQLQFRVFPLLAPRHQVAAAINSLLGSKLKKGDARPIRILRNIVDRGILDRQKAQHALKGYQLDNLPLDVAISQISPNLMNRVAREIAHDLNIPLIDLDIKRTKVNRYDHLGQIVNQYQIEDPVDAKTARMLSVETAVRLSALPVRQTKKGILVAFADPMYHHAKEELELTFGIPVQPAFSPRTKLRKAIQRVLGRSNIGTYLLRAGFITRHQLNNALDFSRNTGVRIGKALLNRGFVTQTQLCQFLAEQADIPLYQLDIQDIDPKVAKSIDAKIARQHGILPLKRKDDRIVIGIVDPTDSNALRIASQTTGVKVFPVLVTENDFENALDSLYREAYVHQSTSDLLTRYPDDSAAKVLSKGQKIAFSAILVLSAIWVLISYRSYIVLWNAVLSLYYVFLFVHLIYQVLSQTLEIPVSDDELSVMDGRDLPIYTILVPVYKEAEVLPDLLQAINNIDYPSTKLDVKVLMEVDDLDTIDVFERLNLPEHFQGIIVPASSPKTKPKACNYGLIQARGEYVVIFDAEDLPDPDQLKTVLAAFGKSDPKIVCIQAKLNFYNRDQNFLTRWFTLEYTLWFDMFLPTLFVHKVPMPLGGTSNHFRRDVLVEVGAWDPHNVTEDADLGLRLFKRGYRSGFIDSTTYEEANSEVYNWIRQRSRWIKGYIQTWLVHMRHPIKLYKELGLKAFLSFHIVYGGAFFAPLINPVYWTMTTVWFLTEWEVLPLLFPGIIYYMASISLYFGNFAFTYVNAIAGFRRKQFALVRYAMLTPLYFGLISIAAWKGFLQLFYKPHFWEKTAHGLFIRKI